jgi:hypothetical protein
MILGLDVSFVPTHRRGPADPCSGELGLPGGFGDDHGHRYRLSEGSRFAMDLAGYPYPPVKKHAIAPGFTVSGLEPIVCDLASHGIRPVLADGATIRFAGPAPEATINNPVDNGLQLSQQS